MTQEDAAIFCTFSKVEGGYSVNVWGPDNTFKSIIVVKTFAQAAKISSTIGKQLCKWWAGGKIHSNPLDSSHVTKCDGVTQKRPVVTKDRRVS